MLATFVDTNLLTASTFKISLGERASVKIKSKHSSDMHNTTNPFIANKTSVSKKLIVIGLQRTTETISVIYVVPLECSLSFQGSFCENATMHFHNNFPFLSNLRHSYEGYN